MNVHLLLDFVPSSCALQTEVYLVACIFRSSCAIVTEVSKDFFPEDLFVGSVTKS